MRRTALLAAILLVFLPQAASADCAAVLAEAQKQFDAGYFAPAADMLRSACGREKLSRTMAVQVQSLLARALLYDDRPDEARREVSKLLRIEPSFNDDAGSPRFADLLAEVRREEQTTQVTSVSKTSESLREAPATVVVVTAAEIERRGYLDLEQLLHDLPGFDVSRTNGDIYSTINQRGYYDEFNSRVLLLVDGVEQNDLTQGTLYLSRQFPLTNIDRVEVIYGPASTMYGANAYTGVISILTKDAAALAGENRRFGLAGHVTAGGYGSRTIDLTSAGSDSGGSVSWSVAGRFQQGRERDLSRFDTWDYTYRNYPYGSLRFARSDGDSGVCKLLAQYIQCDKEIISLTPQGIEAFRNIDRSFVEQNNLGFDDRAKNWGLNAKLQISNLTVGLQSWRSQEGIASAYGARQFAGNTSFTPQETAVYLRYSLRLTTVTLNLFSRYLQTSIDRNGSEFIFLGTPSNFLGTRSSGHVVSGCTATACTLNSGFTLDVVSGGLSNQLRNEISAAWQPSETLSGVAGVEFVKSTVETQYDQTIEGDAHGYLDEPASYKNHTDTALWVQGSWKPRPSLRVIAAGRLTHNGIDNAPHVSGFGTLFTPRLGVIFMPPGRHLVLKAIYSEAFKDPTDTEKFGEYVFPRHVTSGDANPALRPERVRNAELSAGWEPNETTALQASLYQAHYSDVVAFAPEQPGCTSGCTLQEQNIEQYRVRGLEAAGRYKLGAAELWANFTHAQPVRTAPTTARVGNIAANQVNVGADVDWHRMTAAVRTHYSGRRDVGAGTTFADALYTYTSNFPEAQTGAYSTTAVSLSYRDALPNVTLQLLVDNLFDKQYSVVGSRSLPPVLQAGRTLNLRLIYRLEPKSRGAASP